MKTEGEKMVEGLEMDQELGFYSTEGVGHLRESLLI